MKRPSRMTDDKLKFEHVHGAVSLVLAQCGKDVARAVLWGAAGEGVKLADVANKPDTWRAVIDACDAKMAEERAKPKPVGRPLVPFNRADIPADATALTLYLPPDLWKRLDDMRPDTMPLHVYVREVLTTFATNS